MAEISQAVGLVTKRWESTHVRPQVVLHRAFQTTPPRLVQHCSPDAIDGLEMDIQETADADYVVFHDRSITVNNHRMLISGLDSPTLQHLQEEDLPIHHLRDLLAWCARYSLLILDLKLITDLTRFLAELRRANVAKVLLASFDFRVVARIKRLDPALLTAITIGWSRIAWRPLGFLATVLGLLFPVALARSLRCDAIICSTRRVSKTLVARAHSKGLRVLVWEAPSQPVTPALARLGVDVVIISNPHSWHSLWSKSESPSD
jgi:glycerophosphoryl diester phosphodiesterase